MSVIKHLKQRQVSDYLETSELLKSLIVKFIASSQLGYGMW